MAERWADARMMRHAMWFEINIEIALLKGKLLLLIFVIGIAWTVDRN